MSDCGRSKPPRATIRRPDFTLKGITFWPQKYQNPERLKDLR